MADSGKAAAARSGPRGTGAAMKAIIFVVCVLVVVLLVMGTKLNSKIASNEQRVQELEQAIEDEEARVGEIEDLEQSMQSDEYLKQVAKDKLGMVEDDEILFKESK